MQMRVPPRCPAFSGLFARVRCCSRFSKAIGAPRFELGTSPTRTVRATRLRHAPMCEAVSHKAPARYLRLVPAALSDILIEADRLLQPQRFRDYCPNGLQVPGASGVSRIATAVSAHAQSFELAVAEQAQMLIVHHGLFWGSGVEVVDEMLKRRLRILFDADISLAAYHLPLDAHPELGNNALLAKALGAEALEPFARHESETIG